MFLFKIKDVEDSSKVFYVVDNEDFHKYLELKEEKEEYPYSVGSEIGLSSAGEISFDGGESNYIVDELVYNDMNKYF